jgi:hypothetical protein
METSQSLLTKFAEELSIYSKKIFSTVRKEDLKTIQVLFTPKVVPALLEIRWKGIILN